MKTDAVCYMQQDCSLTLEKGLEEFYDVNPQFERRTGSGEMDLFLMRHDTVHVIFGLSTEIDDETLADFSAIFCSDISFKKYLSYFKLLLADTKLVEGIKNDEKIKKLGWLGVGKKVVGTIPKVIKLYRQGRRMSQKWPWVSHQGFYGIPLKDIRTQFGIGVINTLH